MSVTDKIRFIGFCGLDETVCPLRVLLLSLQYPWIEWGFLFRSDLDGTARYIRHSTLKSLTELAANFPQNSAKLAEFNFPTLSENSAELITQINDILTKQQRTSIPLNLAGHLCNDFCKGLLEKKDDILQELLSYGFKRIQINPTSANGIELSDENLVGYSANLHEIFQAYEGKLEFILQFNDETRKLFSLVLEKYGISPVFSSDAVSLDSTPTIRNFSLLNDASCGLGVLITNFNLCLNVPSGFAGGLGPKTLDASLKNLLASLDGQVVIKPVWVDMESSLRTIQENGEDIFDLSKIQQCLDIAVTNYGFPVFL